MIFFRKARKMPLFDLKMFPNILRKIDYHELHSLKKHLKTTMKLCLNWMNQAVLE